MDVGKIDPRVDGTGSGQSSLATLHEHSNGLLKSIRGISGPASSEEESMLGGANYGLHRMRSHYKRIRRNSVVFLRTAKSLSTVTGSSATNWATSLEISCL